MTRLWYLKNRERLLAEKRARYHANPEHFRAISRKSVAKHHDKRLAEKRSWAKNNRVAINAYYRKHRLKPHVQTRHSISNRIRLALKRNSKKGDTLKLLGCSIADLRIYLESNFQPGMTWDNYGSDWQIDHIIPCTIFDLSRPSHQRRCYHFSNLQPLWNAQNRSKSAAIKTNQFNLL